MKTLIAVPCMDFVPTDFLVSFVSYEATYIYCVKK